MRLIRGREDPVLVNRDVPLDSSGSVRLTPARSSGRLCETRDNRLLPTRVAGKGGGRSHSWAVFPNQVAGRGIQSLNNAPRVGQVHDAVVNQRSRLSRTRIVHGPRPCKLQLVHVLPIDLIQWAVAPGIIRATPI